MKKEIIVTDEEIDFDEQLMRFLRNEMSANEEADFKQILVNNPDKKFHAAAVARLIKNIKKYHQQNEQSTIETLQKDNKSKSVKRYIVYIAAAVVIGIGIYFGVMQHKNYTENQTIAENYVKNISINNDLRGSADEKVFNELNELISNVQQSKNIKSTTQRLTEIWQQSLSEEYNDYTNFRMTIGKSLVIANLKNNDRKQAQIVLNQIIENSKENSAINQWAKEIYDKIK